MTAGKFALLVAESLFGAFFAFAVGLLLMILGGIGIAVFAWKGPGLVGTFGAAIWVVAIALEFRFLSRLRQALVDQKYPLPPRMALTMKPWPMPLRPVGAIWFAAHFAMAVFLALGIEQKISLAGLGASMHVIFGAVAAFIAAFVANLYLVMALRALGAGERGLSLFWRRRVIIDLSIAAAACVLPIERWFS